MFTAIMKVENGRIAKYANFATEKEALSHISKLKDPFPDAFVTTLPGSYIGSLKVNPDKTLSLDVPVEPIKKGIGSYAEKLISAIVPSDKVDQMLARAARLNAEVGIKKRTLTAEENSEVDQLIAVDNYRIAVRKEAARFIAEDLPMLTEEEKLTFDPASHPKLKWPVLI